MNQALSAPEFAVLVAEPKVTASVVARAAVVECVARGAVRLERLSVRKLGVTREVHVLDLAPGPVDDVGPVLAPVLEAARTANRTSAADGRSGVAISAWAQRFGKLTGPRGYVTGIVRPALIERELLTARKRRFLLGTGYELSPKGAQLAGWARDSAARLREQVDERARASWRADPTTAAAALAALGALGTLALSDPMLASALAELRRQASPNTTDSTVLAASAGGAATAGSVDEDGAGLDALSHVDLSGLDGLGSADLSPLDSGLSGLDGGGSGHGGFGGFDGGDGGGGDGGAG